MDVSSLLEDQLNDNNDKITHFRRVILEVEVDVRVEQDGLVWQVWLVWWA